MKTAASARAAGFTVLTDSKYLISPDYLLPGDILLYDGEHTSTNVTIGRAARSGWNPEMYIAEQSRN